MLCITLQAATAQYLAGFTGVIASRQLSTLGPQHAATTEAQQMQQRPQGEMRSAKDEANGSARRAGLPLFFAGVQLNSLQHTPSTNAQTHQPGSTGSAVALTGPVKPPPSTLLRGADASKHLLPLVAHTALQPAPRPVRHAAVACLPATPTTSLSPLGATPAALAPAPQRVQGLQLKRRTPSALVLDDRVRDLQLRLHAAGMLLEACHPPSKDLQPRLQATWGLPGTYEPPHRALQLRLDMGALPLRPRPPPTTHLQLRPQAAPLPPEAREPRANELWLVARPHAAALAPTARPHAAALAQTARLPVGAMAPPPSPWQAPAAALQWAPAPEWPPLHAQAAAVLAPAPAGPVAALAAGGPPGPGAALQPPARPLELGAVAAAAAAAVPSRGGAVAGPHRGADQGGGGGAGGSGWQWAGGSEGERPGGEEAGGSGGGQAAGGSYQFMLLLAAALAGVMGLHRWPQHRAALQDAPQPAPAAPPSAVEQRWGEADLQDDEAVHPLIKTMREALEHLEARQAALELEVACLKGIRRPSPDSVERRKEVEEELQSLAILQSAVQQELRRLQA